MEGILPPQRARRPRLKDHEFEARLSNLGEVISAVERLPSNPWDSKGGRGKRGTSRQRAS